MGLVPTHDVHPRLTARRARLRRRHLAGQVAGHLAALVTVALAVLVWLPQDGWRRSSSKPIDPRVFSGVEPKHSELGRPQRWHREQITVVLDHSIEGLGPEAAAAIGRAFAAWQKSGARVPRVRFESRNTRLRQERRDGVNTVLVAPIHIPGHENDLAVTVGFSDRYSGEIVEADVIINARHRFGLLEPGNALRIDEYVAHGVGVEAPSSGLSCQGVPRGCGDRYDLQNVMTHEAGHLFGLGEDRESAAATMYFCTSACETHKREPLITDQAAMVALYADGYPETPTSWNPLRWARRDRRPQ